MTKVHKLTEVAVVILVPVAFSISYSHRHYLIMGFWVFSIIRSIYRLTINTNETQVEEEK